MTGTAVSVFGFLLHLYMHSHVVSGVSWEEWWTYDGISGPAFWGLINPEWSLCNKGKRQSPVNLEPHKLLFDPNLRPLHIDKHRISGTIGNTGHSVILTVDNSTQHHVNLTGGPLSYKYQFQEVHIHYGLHDNAGSEHSINGYMFPAEIQIFGFNSQLYSNFTEALHRAQGIVAISLLLQLGDLSNPELRILTDQLEQIKYGGETVEVKKLSVKGLLPETDYYMTYDGSTTMPACHETVTWVILNKPIYITKQQERRRNYIPLTARLEGFFTLCPELYVQKGFWPISSSRLLFGFCPQLGELHGLRRLMQGDSKHPKAPLGNNFRPPQPLHHRPVRTNIDFNTKQVDGSRYCPSMYKEVYYKANSWKQH